MTLSLVLLFTGIKNGLTEDPRAMTALHGYSIRNNPGPKSDFNIWVVTQENAFQEEFIPGEGATLKPDFEKQLVVAVSAETHNYVYRAIFERSVLDKNGLHVYFSMKKENVDAVQGGVSLAALEKTPGLKAVHFYHNNIRIRTVPIVSVY